MPRGQKTCPECHKGCGPRCSICPHCGHEFVKKTAAKAKTVSPDKRTKTSKNDVSQKNDKEQDNQAKKESFFRSGIHTPSGIPPVKPQGFVGPSPPKMDSEVTQYFPDGFDEETVREWAIAVKTRKGPHGSAYSVNAIKYWSRYFWNLHDKETFNKVKKAIDAEVGTPAALEQTFE